MRTALLFLTLSLAPAFGADPPAEHFRVCIRASEHESWKCSQRLRTEEDAKDVAHLLATLPVPADFDIAIMDTSEDSPKHEQDHSGETKI